jgi:hypothetical protein
MIVAFTIKFIFGYCSIIHLFPCVEYWSWSTPPLLPKNKFNIIRWNTFHTKALQRKLSQSLVVVFKAMHVDLVKGFFSYECIGNTWLQKAHNQLKWSINLNFCFLLTFIQIIYYSNITIICHIDVHYSVEFKKSIQEKWSAKNYLYR